MIGTVDEWQDPGSHTAAALTTVLDLMLSNFSCLPETKTTACKLQLEGRELQSQEEAGAGLLKQPLLEKCIGKNYRRTPAYSRVTFTAFSNAKKIKSVVNTAAKCKVG